MQQINYHHSMPSNGAENCQWPANYNPPEPYAYQIAANQESHYPNSWPIEGTETARYNTPYPSAYLAGDVARAPSMPNAYNNEYTHPPLSNYQAFPPIETLTRRGEPQSYSSTDGFAN